ncbi:MAG: YncE family protein [Anaerolineae bacterium]
MGETRVYVSAQRAHLVAVYRPGEIGIRRQIRVGDRPHGVAVTPAGLLAVACWGGVHLVDVNTSETRAVGGQGRIQYHGTGISRDGKVYVTTGDHGTFVLVLNAETGRELGAIDHNIHGPTGLVAAKDGCVYIANCQTPFSIAVVQNDSVTATIELKQRPHGLSLSADESLLYVAEPLSGTITMISLADRIPTTRIHLGGRPCAIAAMPEKKLYVVDSARNSVGVLESENQMCGWIPVGRSPGAIAISADRAYVVNRGDGSLSVVDTDNDRLVQTVSVGYSLWDVAVG